jgi:hypothetical protein
LFLLVFSSTLKLSDHNSADKNEILKLPHFRNPILPLLCRLFGVDGGEGAKYKNRVLICPLERSEK